MTGSFSTDMDFKIGLTASRMFTLRDMKIPPPDQAPYKPGAVLNVRLDYSRVWDGYASFDWVWDTIALSSIYKLIELLNGAESGNVYVVTPKRITNYPNPQVSLGLFSAVMWKPDVSGEEGTFVVKSPYALQTVKVPFVKAVELSGVGYTI